MRLEKVNSLNQQRYAVLKDVTLSIKEGQILGIAGVEGNGQAELVEVITGLRPITSGNIFLYEQDITGFSPRKIRELNIGHIPEDRRKRGYIADYSVAENLVLGSHYKPPFAKGLFINFPEVNKLADRLINDYDIRPASKDNLLKSLSGGNQQKVIVARELYKKPILLIASQPTRGLDVGSIEFVHKQLLLERSLGKAILLISAELDEIMSLSDVIAVIYEGEIVEILENKNIDRSRLGFLMTGGGSPGKYNTKQDTLVG